MNECNGANSDICSSQNTLRNSQVYSDSTGKTTENSSSLGSWYDDISSAKVWQTIHADDDKGNDDNIGQRLRSRICSRDGKSKFR